MRRIVVTLALAAAVAAFLPAPAWADEGGGGDNAAIAVNTKDGASVFRFAFKIRRVAGEIVDNTNAAVAYASCDSCQTTAIAIQIVLVMDAPDVVAPQNLALAINQQCTLCETFASATQFVLTTSGAVRFTAEGNRELAEIKRLIRALKREELTAAELKARLDPLIQRIRTVIETQLVPAGKPRDDGEEEEERAPPPTTTGTTTEPTTAETTPTTPTTPTTTATEPTTTETAP